MYHFFAQHENIHDTYIDITGDDVNHVKNVLRMKTGDELLISSGSNVDYYCHISEMTDDNIRAEIDSIDEEGCAEDPGEDGERYRTSVKDLAVPGTSQRR